MDEVIPSKPRCNWHSRDATVTVQLDGRPIIHWQGPQRSLNMFPVWAAGEASTIGLALAEVDITLEQFDFTPLDAGSRLLEPLPNQPPILPTGASVVAMSVDTDLLSLVRLDRGAISLEVKRIGPELQLSAADESNGRLAVPVWPRGAYRAACDFTVSSPKMSCGVVLPLSQKRVLALLLNKAKPVGLSKINNEFPEGPQNPTRTTKGRVTAGRRHQLLIRVVPAGANSEIHVELDDQPFYSWKGSEDDLSLWTNWETPHQKMIALVCEGGTMTCHMLKLKMLSGEAWILVPQAAATRE